MSIQPKVKAEKTATNLSAWEILGGSQVLGDRVKSNLAWHSLIVGGFPFRTIRRTAERLKLTERALAELVGISRSTFDRRKEQGRLNDMESERVYRIARIYAETLKVLEPVEKAVKWFREPKRALHGQKPLDMLGTEAGSREVENILERLLYGGYS